MLMHFFQFAFGNQKLNMTLLINLCTYFYYLHLPIIGADAGAIKASACSMNASKLIKLNCECECVCALTFNRARELLKKLCVTSKLITSVDDSKLFDKCLIDV